MTSTNPPLPFTVTPLNTPEIHIKKIRFLQFDCGHPVENKWQHVLVTSGYRSEEGCILPVLLLSEEGCILPGTLY